MNNSAILSRGLLGLVGLVFFVGCGDVVRHEPQPTGKALPAPDSPAPDNTRVNQRDTKPGTVTPIDQDENQRDIKISADIRKRVHAEADMSVNARNCKIITSGGKVTLRGPVETQAEKDAIAEIAGKVAGEENVDNQLEVKR